jgi:hypothetical protein
VTVESPRKGEEGGKGPETAPAPGKKVFDDPFGAFTTDENTAETGSYLFAGVFV